MILVTGTAGFIGFHLAKKLLDDGRDVIGYDNVNDYYDPTLKKARLAILMTVKSSHFTARI
jgi:UDP-glucuronate 4-epimerase